MVLQRSEFSPRVQPLWAMLDGLRLKIGPSAFRQVTGLGQWAIGLRHFASSPRPQIWKKEKALALSHRCRDDRCSLNEGGLNRYHLSGIGGRYETT